MGDLVASSAVVASGDVVAHPRGRLPQHAGRRSGHLVGGRADALKGGSAGRNPVGLLRFPSARSAGLSQPEGHTAPASPAASLSEPLAPASCLLIGSGELLPPIDRGMHPRLWWPVALGGAAAMRTIVSRRPETFWWFQTESLSLAGPCTPKPLSKFAPSGARDLPRRPRWLRIQQTPSQTGLPRLVLPRGLVGSDRIGWARNPPDSWSRARSHRRKPSARRRGSVAMSLEPSRSPPAVPT